jgi:hypothetical protein
VVADRSGKAERQMDLGRGLTYVGRELTDLKKRAV